MKQSEKIMKLVKTLTETRESDLCGKDWEWVKNNTDFAEWYQDALTLERFIDALKPRWIPISERLPNDCERVWVCADNSPQHLPRRAFYIYRFGIWRNDEEDIDSVYSELNVTHWMPLPELPEAQQ